MNKKKHHSIKKSWSCFKRLTIDLKLNLRERSFRVIETNLSSALITTKLIILQKTAEVSKKIRLLWMLQTRKTHRAFTEHIDSQRRITSQKKQRRSLWRLTSSRKRSYIKHIDFLSWIFSRRMFYKWWHTLWSRNYEQWWTVKVILTFYVWT